MADAKPINEKIVEVHDRTIKSGYESEGHRYNEKTNEFESFDTRDKSKGEKLPTKNSHGLGHAY